MIAWFKSGDPIDATAVDRAPDVERRFLRLPEDRETLITYPALTGKGVDAMSKALLGCQSENST